MPIKQKPVDLTGLGSLTMFSFGQNDPNVYVVTKNVDDSPVSGSHTVHYIPLQSGVVATPIVYDNTSGTDIFVWLRGSYPDFYPVD